MTHFALSRRFLPLFGTQFFGAFNDNLFKTALFVMISYHGLGADGILPASQMLNFGALLFILPYFLFSALSGEICHKYDKAKVARWVKVCEILIMLIAAYGFYQQSTWILFSMIFCMGTHSTLFGPLKYSSLPEYLQNKELMMGNSLIESGTFIAILLGQILGSLLAGTSIWFIICATLSVAIMGTLCSFSMPYLRPQHPQQVLHFHLIRNTHCLLREAKQQDDIFTAIIGISWFWLIGAVYTTQLPTFTQIHLGGNEHVFNLMLTLFSIGIALGSLLCAKFSRHQVRLAWVCIGALGLSMAGGSLIYLTHDAHHTHTQGIMWFMQQTSSWAIIVNMIAIGLFGGFFSVPLYTWLQTASTDAFRSHAIAANNIINGLFMVLAALMSALLLWLFDSIILLYALTSIGNLVLIAYLIKRNKAFLRF